jgi:PAS domain S-box-containing protein
LQTLKDYGVLDTPPDEAFDRLTGLAASLFDAPIALVSLVDAERQWFKSHHGLDIQSTPRDWSICSHAIQQPPRSTLVIEDATADPRFKCNPLVVGPPKIRFYAGAVLSAPDGHNLGSLCVIDSQPRPTPSQRDLNRLQLLAAIAVDELELMRAKRSADERQRLLDMAERMSGVGSWSFDETGGRRSWSAEVYRIHGVSRDTFKPDWPAILELYHEDDRATLERLVEEARRTGRGYEHELRIRRPDGEVREVMFKAECQTDLERGRARYKFLADNVADVITRLRLDGGSVYSSPSIHRMLGFQPEELAQTRPRDLIHEDDWPQVMTELAALSAGAAERTVEFRAVHKDGRTVWLESAVRLVRDHNGAPIEIVAVTRDIDARKALQESLANARDDAQELARRAERAEAVAGLGHWRFDARTHELYWSPEMYRIYGLDPSAPLDRDTLVAMTHPEDVETTGAMIRQVLDQGFTDQETVTRIVRVDGEIRYIAGRWQVERSVDGEILAAVGTALDVTSQKQAESELRKARADAEAATAVKSEFLANMSHELRTPLTSIVGFTRLALEQDGLGGLARDYVERVADASRALLSSVNDILDFSKLEAGQVSLHPQPTSLSHLVTRTLDLFLPQAAAKDLRLDLEVDEGAEHLTLSIDPDRVRQILLNLVGNALKFTVQGGVTLRARYEAGPSELVIEVADTGVGVPTDKQAALFQRFSQVDGSLTRSHTGTGLGLAICKGLVEAMGGTIGVESAVGVGSRFWFRIPAPVESASPAPPAGRDGGVDLPVFAGLSMLVADDHAANRELARLVLLGLGAEVAEAEDGEAAVRMAAEQRFDVVLMDLRMPRLDGLQALCRIRQAQGPNRSIPILAFTADVDSEVAARLMSAGFDGLVAKPLNLVALIDTVAEAVSA